LKRTIIIITLFLNIAFAKAQVVGELYGTVIDEKNVPVLGANVIIDNIAKGSQTDIDGNYRILNIEPGTYNVTVSYIGYKTQTRYNVIIRSRGSQAINFSLQESSEVLKDVVISNANKISRPRETPLSTQTLSAVEIATYPGSNNDVVQVAQTLPGVSPSIGGFRNDLIIRGGAPNETVYYLDGMEVPNINHFSTQGSAGGPVGIVNVSFIENVTLSTSAFGAQYDNPLSGVLQFSQRNGDNKKFKGNFRISASEAALTLETPLFKGEKEEGKTTLLASVRRSYLEFLFEAIGLPIRPNYWDYQFKINHQVDTYNSISFLGLGSVDNFTVEAPETFDADQQASLDQSPFIEQTTYALGATWKNRFKNGNGFMQTTLSTNSLNNNFTRYEDSENETGVLFNNDSKESETKLRYQVTNFLGDWKITSGFNTQFSKYSNETSNIRDNIFFNTSIDFIKYGIFSNVTKSFVNNKLDLSFGFRVDDDTFTDKDNLISTFSPRFSISYEFIEDWRVSGSIGRYFKIPPYTILGFKNNAGALVNRNSDYTKSDHYVLGLQHYFGPSSSISLEGFYKKYNDYPISVVDGVSLANKGGGFEVLGSEAIETDGKGRSYGLELQFQQKLTNNFYGIFSYTFFYSEFTGFDTNAYKPSVWDSRHLVSFTTGYKLKRNWEISSRYRFAGNTPFVPTNLDETLQSYPQIVLDYDRLGDEKLDTFSQLDIRIDKKWNFEKISLDVFIEVQNILGQSTPQPTDYGLARNEIGEITNPRSLVAIDEGSGTIIPSIGIVLDF
jgi:outer membrane receptor protein involved in Fe transport